MRILRALLAVLADMVRVRGVAVLVVEEDLDAHAERALAIAAEESPLIREIYAAQSLHRDGVDVFAKAPREIVP